MKRESDRKNVADEPANLTARQLKAIPMILAARTYDEGCKKAKIGKTTLYTWLHDPVFRSELERQRDEMASAAFGILSQGLTRAVEALVGLVGDKDKRLRRLAAKDVIEHYLKHKELKELEERIAAVEQKMGQ